MNTNQFTKKLESLESTSLESTQTLISEIIQLVESAGEEVPAVNWALLKIAETTTKTKQVEPVEKLKYYETLMKYAIETALKFDLEAGAESLRLFFDCSSEIYRKNLHDNNVQFPLSRERPLNHYFPVVGEQCDVVRPGLTTTAKMGWTRCKVLSISNSGAYTVRFMDTTDSHTMNDGYWFAPLETRTEDLDWKLKLQVGDLVDALDNKNVWLLSTISQVQVEQNGCKKLRITFRYFDEKGDRTDSEGNTFFGWGANEDEWIEVSNPRIQKPGKMRKGLCYYASTTHNEYCVEDSYDIVFEKEFQEKPFYSMLRSTFTRSQLIYSLFNLYVEQGGIAKQIKLTQEGKKVDAICFLSVATALGSFMPPRMIVKDLYSEYMDLLLEFVRNNAKLMNNQRLDMIFYCLQALGKRILTLCEKHDMIENLKKFLIPKFLTGNLEKQLLALQFIYNLIKPMRPHTEQSELEFVKYIQQNSLFYLMYQQNESHEQVLYRSTQFLQYMLKKQIITLKQIGYLWNLYPLNDAKNRVTLQKLIGDVIHEMNNEQITYLLDKLLEIQPQDFTFDHLQLLNIMNNKKKLQGQSYTRALDLLWQLMTVKSASVKPAVEAEVEKIFKTFITNIPDQRVKFQLLNSMLNCLKEAQTIEKQCSFLKEYILSYKSEKQQTAGSEQYPTTRSEVVAYLSKNNVYAICLKHLANTKAEHKIQQILNLLGDILKADSGDNKFIGKQVYLILGPSEINLRWLASLTEYLADFINQMFSITDLKPFSTISLSALNALTSMFNDINSFKQKRRYVKDKITVSDIVEMEWNTFVFTMCKPEELIGMSFMQNLLEVVQNPLVSTKLIEFIAKVSVQLDQTLFDQVEDIRKKFLSETIHYFQQVNKEEVLTDETKHKLLSKISILNQFIDETEINGLKGIKPYFQTLKGDKINIKIQNNVAGNKKPKELELFVTDNITLEEFKDEVSLKLEQKIQEISLLKGKRVYEDKLQGKSLADLRITKGDVIKVEKAKIPEALKAPLLNQDKTGLSEKMKQVSTRIYSIYADLEKGTILSKANFFKICAQIAKANGKDDEAKKMNEQDNQQNKDIQFSQQELDKQFFDRIKQKEEPIWKFVQSLGIQQDLKVEHKQATKDLPITAMPRYILSDPSVYNILLSMLQNPRLQKDHTLIYKLLCSLPTYPKLKEEIFGDWDPSTFNKKRSIYEIDYLLGLVQVQLQRQNSNFCFVFTKMGPTLIKYVKEYGFQDKANSIYNLTSMQRVVIGSVIRILTGYVRIWVQPDPLASKLFFEKINEIELNNFIEILSKEAEINKHDVQYKQKFADQNIQLPIDEISALGMAVFENLNINYKQNYIKEITPEAARLCSILCRSYPQNTSVMIESLRIDSINLRRTNANLLYFQATMSNEFLASILEGLLKNIPTDNKSPSSQYFELLSKLIQLSIKQNAQTVDLKVLAEQLINKILAYNSEERRNSIVSDRVAYGLLSVIESILVSKPEIAASLTSYKWKLLNRGLFYPDPTEKIQNLEISSEILNNPSQPEFFEDYTNTKCLGSRKVLINVVIELLKHHQQNEPDFLEELLIPIFKQLPQKFSKPSSKSNMVGIKNLGGICYLSSMCQSLNSISAFRNGISMVAKEDSKLISSTQRMLAYLLYSQRMDFTPTPFLQSFREPINPNIQQDTTEFLNLYFDQLESELQTTPYRSLLRQLFQGSTVVQMICHNCKHKRERKEQYYCYSVGVREKPTLELALEGMHEGDIINDYNCEYCNTKSDLTKRSVLGDLPNFLFLHLQRIVNLDFYRYTKIHSKCLFPLELNIEPFTKQGVELREQFGVEYLKKLQQNEEELKKFNQLAKHGKADKSYIYNLKAIIVHSGSAEGGHYYTILKRDGGWIKLDDSKCSIFSLEQFQAECYGGPFNVIGEWGMEESKNAYVLLYEKQLKQKIHLDFADRPEEVEKFEMDLETAVQGVDYDKFKPYNIPALYKQVWMDNHRLMVETHIFGDNNNKDFIRLVDNASQNSNSPRKAHLIAEVITKISPFSNEVGGLIDQFEKSNPGYDVFLSYAKDFDNIFNLIFHGEKPIRVAISKFLSILVLNSLKEGSAEQIYKLLDFFISRLNTDVAKSWLRVESYFEFLETIVTHSTTYPELYKYIIDKHLISLLIDFILEKESPLKISIKKHSMGNKFNRVQFEGGVRIIAWLLSRSYYLNGKNEEQVEGERFHLSDNDILVLSSMNFYNRMIKEGQAIPVIAGMIEKFSFENYGFTEAISRALLRLLNDSMERLQEGIHIISCIQKILLSKDSIWKKKAEFLIGIGQPYQVNKDNTFSFMDIDRFTYVSALQDIFPIECVANLAFMSRQRYPEISVYLINSMLKIALSSQTAHEYFLVQPPPNYLYTTYTDWWDSFLTFAFGIITVKTIKEQELNRLKIETTELLSAFRAKTNNTFDTRTITGKIIKTKRRQVIKHQEIGISLIIQDIEVYTTISQPSADRQTNNTFDKYLTHQKLEDADDSISAESNILNFMTTSKPPLAITQNQKVETASNKAQTSEVKQEGPKRNQVYFDSDQQKEMDQVQFNETEVNQKQNAKPAEQQILLDMTTSTQPKAKEVQYHTVNIESPITTCDYFRNLIINNLADESIWVRLQSNVDYTKMNCILPHLISGNVLAHKSQTIILYRLDPSKQISSFEYNLQVEDYGKRKKKVTPPNFFKLYGEHHEQPVGQMQVEEPVENIQEPAPEPQKDVKYCPICTFENDSFAQKCEVCQSAFM